MKLPNCLKLFVVLAITLGTIFAGTAFARSASAAEIDQKSRAVVQKLYANSPAARRVGHSAIAVLVFPEIVRRFYVR